MAKVTGLDNVLKNLNTEIRAIENRTGDGLLAAALFVQGESQEDTPQRKGVLVNSAFSDVDRDNLVARVGYTAKYAPYVHEMPSSFNYTKPGTGPKFLEKAIKNNIKTILDIIQRRAKVD